jgi:glycosyltransferase involved in cell wall biosynthesis
VPPEPLVSILINNHNYGRYLRACIASALEQSYRSVEVVVVDDGSTDDSVAIIRSYGTDVVVVCQENGGQASAFNAGFAASRGEIVCLLDSDDMFLPGKARTVVDLLSSQAEAGWCFHDLQSIDETGGFRTANGPSGNTLFRDFRSEIARGRLPYTPPATSGLCFRRSLLSRILPMPESVGITLSDHYLKFAALSLAPGIVTGARLACQRQHGANAYTGRGRRPRGRIAVHTAYWLWRRFPHLDRFYRNLLAGGLGTLAATGGPDPAAQRLADECLAALPVWQRLEVILRVQRQRWRREPERAAAVGGGAPAR